MKLRLPKPQRQHITSGLLFAITMISFQGCNQAGISDATSADAHHAIDPALMSNELSVQAISIDREGPHQPFFHHLIQFDSDTSDIVLATMDQEYLHQVSKAKETHDTTDQVVTPQYVWKIDSGTNVARFVGPEGWDHTRQSIKVASHTELDARKRRAVRRLAGEGMPTWWPSDERARVHGEEFGVVIPNQPAIAYLLMGREVSQSADIWGPIHTYAGPYAIVVERFENDQKKIYVANLLGDFKSNGLSMELSSDGTLAVITTAGAHHMWLVNIEELCK